MVLSKQWRMAELIYVVIFKKFAASEVHERRIFYTYLGPVTYKARAWRAKATMRGLVARFTLRDSFCWSTSFSRLLPTNILRLSIVLFHHSTYSFAWLLAHAGPINLRKANIGETGF